jgi:hypothetical protein
MQRDMRRHREPGGAGTRETGARSLSYTWTEQLSTYYEVAERTGAHDPRGGIVIVATGFTYQFAKNLQIDAGVNIGVTAAADPINPFVGFSARF